MGGEKREADDGAMHDQGMQKRWQMQRKGLQRLRLESEGSGQAETNPE